MWWVAFGFFLVGHGVAPMVGAFSDCEGCDEERGCGVGPPPAKPCVEDQRGEDAGTETPIEEGHTGLGREGFASEFTGGHAFESGEAEHDDAVTAR